ncbi:cytochrome c oxidase assembly protein [Haematococcus lacustris]
MSAAFGGPRSQARAPEKGVFPLDHFAECKKVADAYLQCINSHDGEAIPCIELSKQYLRNLMVKQDLKELGMEQGLLEVTTPTPTPPAQQ